MIAKSEILGKFGEPFVLAGGKDWDRRCDVEVN